MKNTPKIVVNTPTGHVGSRVVQLLIQAGVHPTVLVRDPSRLAAEIHSFADIHQGDLFDESFVLESTKDADALLWVIPENPKSEDPLGDIRKLGKIAAQAVSTNEIHRTVFLSSGGAEVRKETLIGALGDVEEMLNETGANVLNLRSGMLFTNLLADAGMLKEGNLVTTTPLDLKSGWNDPRDVGDIAAARLLSPEWTGQLVQHVHGPEDLSYADVAGILSGVLGKPVKPVRISDGDLRKGLLDSGASEAHAGAMIAMLQSAGSGELTQAKRGYITTTPTTLASWAFEKLRPLVIAA
ncbi:MAG: NmrA family transcriptional regulator [Akkermansiaceae bacterium]|nr:NmrA family transcriptional regulator [Akkermansiaceae bacterium]